MSNRSKVKFTYTRRTLDDYEHAKNSLGSNNRETFIIEKFSTRIFKRHEGDNLVRILPPAPSWAEEYRHYGIPVFRHFNVGPDRNVVLCPWKMRQQFCPICAAFKEAKEHGDEEMLRQLRVSSATMVWMLDMLESDPEKHHPLLWFIPYSLDAEILEQSRDKKRKVVLPIDDPFEGFDISFTYDPKAAGSKMYSGVQVDREPSAIADSDNEIESLLNFIMEYPLPDLLIHHSSEEVEKLFSGGLDVSAVSHSQSSNRTSRKAFVHTSDYDVPETEPAVNIQDLVEEEDVPPVEDEESEEEEVPPTPVHRRARVSQRATVTNAEPGLETPAQRRARLAAKYKEATPDD